VEDEHGSVIGRKYADGFDHDVMQVALERRRIDPVRSVRHGDEMGAIVERGQEIVRRDLVGSPQGAAGGRPQRVFGRRLGILTHPRDPHGFAVRTVTKMTIALTDGDGHQSTRGPRRPSARSARR
jgi:hypothetical protein